MKTLEKAIIAEIEKNGPITFEKFMNLALYDKKYGYYTGGNTEIGKEGDFYTSPHVHPAFGEVISNFILKAKSCMGEGKFTIIEIGAGKGYLAFDILNNILKNSPQYNNVNYIIIDKNEKYFIRDLQKFKNKIIIYNDISKLEDIYNGIVISNELFDSLPFHKLLFKENKLYEYYVDYESGKFRDIIDDLSDRKIIAYLERYKLNLSNLKQMEVNLRAGKLLKKVSSILNSGFFLTIDYGFLYEDLFSNEKPEGTYRCFYKNSVNSKTYQNIGNQDITADVDFSNLILTGIDNGLKKLKYTTQAQFLVDWGILDIFEKAVSSDNIGTKAIKNLFLPGMMGNYFKVLIQQKNINVYKDFYPESELKVSFGIN